MLRFLLLAFALPLASQDFAARHAEALAANPPDLEFRIHTSAPARFHIGERIPLTLQFSSPSPRRYRINATPSDLPESLDRFVPEQAVAEPLRDLSFGPPTYSADIGGAAFRLVPPPDVLGAEPVSIDLRLNRWLRFDAPDHYRVYAQSNRISRVRTADDPPGPRTIYFPVTSNVLEIEILPHDAEWESARLALADRGMREPAFVEDPATADNLETLRDLASPAAVERLLDFARGRGHAPDFLDLLGARDRRHATRALDRFLADPDHPIHARTVRLCALLRFIEEEAPPPLSPWHPGELDDAARAAARERESAREKKIQEFVAREAAHLIPIAQSQPPEISVQSMSVLTFLAPDAVRAAGLLPPEDFGLTREQLRAQFLTLPEADRVSLIREKWSLVRGPEMIPVLHAVIQSDSEFAVMSALGRLAQLAPGEATQILRANMIAGRFGEQTLLALTLLPAAAIPEADAAFSRFLGEGDGREDRSEDSLAAHLPWIARFGSAALAPRLQKRYASETWPCPEDHFVVYFLRNFPNDLSPLHRALGPDKPSCNKGLLQRVAADVWSSALEAQAVAWLDDPDPELVSSAAAALALRGGIETEALLWRRIERWTEEWRDRTAVLFGDPITGGGSEADQRLGEALFRAIAGAKAWPFDAARRARLRDYCLDYGCRNRWRAEADAPVVISQSFRFSGIGIRVGDYEAGNLENIQDKMRQLGPSVLFRWCADIDLPWSPGLGEEWFEKVSAFAAQHSLRLERCR